MNMKLYFLPLFWGSLLAVSLALFFTSCFDGVITEDETSSSVNALGEWVAPSPQDNDLYTVYLQDNDIYIITDPETGVQYIVYREKAYNAGMGGITPRLRPDGSLYVVDVEGVQ